MVRKCFTGVLLCAAGAAHAASQVSMNVRDLKTGEVEAKISVPLWVAKAGLSLSKVFEVRADNVDLSKLVAALEKQGHSGPFLVIEDIKENKKVTFNLE